MGPGHLFDDVNGWVGVLGVGDNRPGGGSGPSGGITNWGDFFNNFYSNIDWGDFWTNNDWGEFFNHFYSNIDWGDFWTNNDWSEFFTNFYSNIDWDDFWTNNDWSEFFGDFYSNIDWDVFFDNVDWTEFFADFDWAQFFTGFYANVDWGDFLTEIGPDLTTWLQSNLSLDDLSDVTISGLADEEALVYNAGSGQWENTALSGGGPVSVALDDLTDVVITGVADQDVLVYDGGDSQWENYTIEDFRALLGGGLSFFFILWENVDGLAAAPRDIAPTMGAGVLNHTALLILHIIVHAVDVTGAGMAMTYSFGDDNPAYSNIRTPTPAYIPSATGFHQEIVPTARPVIANYADIVLHVQAAATTTTATYNFTIIGLVYHPV